MSTAFRLNGVTLAPAAYPPFSRFSPPVLPHTSDLAGLYMLGGRIDLSAVNQANPALPSLPVGEPEMVPGGAVISRDGFDTQIDNTGDLTVFSVCRVLQPASSALGQLVLSTYKPGADVTGDSFGFTFAGSRPRFAVYTSDAGGSAGFRASAFTDVGFTLGEYALFAARAKSTGETRVWGRQGEYSIASSESAAMERSISDRSYMIGSGHATGSNFQADLTVSMVAVFTAAMSDSDVADTLDAIAAAYVPMGLDL